MSRLYVDETLLPGLNSQPPEDLVYTLLRHFIARTKASGGAVLTAEPNKRQLSLYVARGLSDLAAQSIRPMWKGHRESLLEGATVRTGAALMAPLHLDGVLRGILFLSAPEGSVVPQELHLLTATLTMAQSTTAAGAHLAVSITHRDLQKQELIDALRRAGNNKSVAARLLKISRRAVYLRMDRLGVSVPV